MRAVVREPPAVNYLTAKIGFDVRRRPLTAYAHTSCEQWNISNGSASKQTGVTAAHSLLLFSRLRLTRLFPALPALRKRLLAPRSCPTQLPEDWPQSKCRSRGKCVLPASLNNCRRHRKSSSKRLSLTGQSQTHASLLLWGVVGASKIQHRGSSEMLLSRGWRLWPHVSGQGATLEFVGHVWETWSRFRVSD